MRYITILAILIAMYYKAPSQKLIIERNDVEPYRSHFITATYMFSIDIVAKEVFKCTGVTFELLYNNAEEIKFSNWTVLGFGTNPNSLVIPIVNNSQGIIHIGVLSNDLLENPVFDEPRVIRLEFVVSQSAPHNRITRFSFRNPKAVVNTDTIGKIIDLVADSYEYIIHSFVNVWPGDADNNGKVTTDDVAMIGYLLGLGTRTKSMKSFKRPSNSILWAPQRVLAWDSASATYADCDGNGDITIRDVLVVSINFGKTQFSYQGKNPNEEIQSKKYAILEEKNFETNYSKSIPVYVSVPEGSFGVYGKIRLNKIKGKILGIQRGNIFSKDKSYFIFDISTENMLAEIAFGSINGLKTNRSGVYKFCDIIYEPDDYETSSNIEIQELIAATNFGFQSIDKNLFTTKIDDIINSNDTIFQQNNKILIKNLNAPLDVSDIKIYNIYGAEIGNFTINKTNNEIDISNLYAGVYLLIIQNSQNLIIYHFLKY